MAETAIKERGEINFTEAGKGVVVRFRNSDLKRIEAEIGADFFRLIVEGVMAGNTPWATFELCVEHGVKKDGKPFVVPEEIMDEIPVHRVWDYLVDGLCMSMKGLTLKEHMDKTVAAYLDAQTKGELPSQMSPESPSSTISEEEASGPASDQKSSGA